MYNTRDFINVPYLCFRLGSGTEGFPLADVDVVLAQGQLFALNSPGSLC